MKTIAGTAFGLMGRVVALALGCVAASSAAQTCPPAWMSSGDGYAGVSGISVQAVVRWDPDGAGAGEEMVVVGGGFQRAGREAASRIAMLDPRSGTWSPLGEGLQPSNSAYVYALAAMPDGSLVAGGSFDRAGTVSASNIAAWDGQGWQALGAGLGGTVRALATHPDGSLIAGGHGFGVARWNGSGWSAVGSDIGGTVKALIVLPDGDVVAGGDLTVADVSGIGLARWSGSQWMPVGNATNWSVSALALSRDGALIAGGYFTFEAPDATTGQHVARWNGTAWEPVGSSPDGTVTCLKVLANGDLIAGGSFGAVGSLSVNQVARWNGSSWSALGGGVSGPNPWVRGLAELSDGQLVAAGEFDMAGGRVALGVALWGGRDCPMGCEWTMPTPGMTLSPDAVGAMAVLPSGELYAAGRLSTAGGLPVGDIGRWNGATWSALGQAPVFTSTSMPAVNAVALRPDGDLFVGGEFTSAAGVQANRIARWNGEAWSALGSGLNGTVHALAVLPNGDVIAGGEFQEAGGVGASNIARWNGMAWSALGSGINGTVEALAVLGNGDLVAGGTFTTAGAAEASNIARWNGVAWSALGSGLGSGINGTVEALAVLGNGDLVAGGTFTTAGAAGASNIARWNGVSWSALGSGLGSGIGGRVMALAVDAADGVIAGGSFTSYMPDGSVISGLARWNGVSWSAVGNGMISGDVLALAMLPCGDLMVAGRFDSAGSLSGNVYLGRYRMSATIDVALDPQSKSLVVGERLTLTAMPANGYEGVRVKWQRDGVDVSPDDPRVSGALASLESPTYRTVATLTIVDAAVGDAGTYRAVFTDVCGVSTASEGAGVCVGVSCAADFNSDGGVDGADVEAFLFAWMDGRCAADVNLDGGVDGFDLETFFATWQAGGC
jgi:hypothetical protein